MGKEEKFTFWKEQDMWLGFLERFPDYWTQGESIEELKENLKDLFHELTGEHLPDPRQTGILTIA
jgi:predicted RNase H-like HicB family nuclease